MGPCGRDRALRAVGHAYFTKPRAWAPAPGMNEPGGVQRSRVRTADAVRARTADADTADLRGLVDACRPAGAKVTR